MGKNNNYWKNKRNEKKANNKGNGSFSLSTTNPLVQTACRFPFSYRVGETLNFGLNANGKALSSHSLPGVMSISYVPSIGIASDWTAPVNRAASDEYAFVVHLNSRNTSYEAADLMMYYLSAASLFAYHSFLVRVYNIARKYIPTNIYSPKDILLAMGVDPDIAVGTNLANLRSLINSFGMAIQRYRVPQKFNILPVWNRMNSDVFMDDPSPDKAQFYVFRPEGFYRFDPYTDKRGGRLVLEPIPANKEVGNIKCATFTNLEQMTQILLASIENEEDIGMIMGDVENAYGTASCYTVDIINDEPSFEFKFDQSFGSMLNNAIIVYGLDTATCTIAQSNGLLTHAPSRKASETTGAWFYNGNPNYIITADSIPAEEELYKLTQFMPSLKGNTITSCGPVILTGCRMIVEDKPLHFGDSQILQFEVLDDLVSVQAQTFIWTQCCLEKFLFAPRVYYAATTQLDSEIELISFSGDVNQYAFISMDEVKEINAARNMADVGFGSNIYSGKAK